jgi:hypothetical protein
MPGFVVKVTEKMGDLMSPMTVYCKDAQTAESLVRGLSFVEADDRVEAKELRDDVMKKAFGVQAEDTIAVRSDWIWQGDQPSKK